MPKGTIDAIPEIYSNVEAWLPRGVTIVSAEPYGGAMRLEVEGNAIEEGESYQLIITDDPMRRTIEMRKNGG